MTNSKQLNRRQAEAMQANEANKSNETKVATNQLRVTSAARLISQLSELKELATKRLIESALYLRSRLAKSLADERGDVPGWVLVVLMTTGLVTAIWAIAKPNLTSILNNSLNAMNGVR